MQKTLLDYDKKPIEKPLKDSLENGLNHSNKNPIKEPSKQFISWPCPTHLKIPVEDRPSHIYNSDGSFKCPECKRLIEELEKQIF